MNFLFYRHYYRHELDSGLVYCVLCILITFAHQTTYIHQFTTHKTRITKTVVVMTGKTHSQLLKRVQDFLSVNNDHANEKRRVQHNDKG
jgi:hypothetical protein